MYQLRCTYVCHVADIDAIQFFAGRLIRCGAHTTEADCLEGLLNQAWVELRSRRKFTKTHQSAHCPAPQCLPTYRRC